MTKFIKAAMLCCLFFILTGCGTNKKIIDLNTKLDESQMELSTTRQVLDECKKQKSELNGELANEKSKFVAAQQSKEELVRDLKAQIEDLKKQREQQYSQVGDLTVLSKSANENIGQTIKQLAQKDKYINFLMDARSKADSINLALSINLKQVLREGIADEDVEVKVDKTVVFINLSDKMLFQSGSYVLTPRASEVLAKIAQVAKSKPDLELMVEGYTDDMPIRNSCMEDNWDLSVKRASAVVRSLAKDYGINPNKLIAAGRGEFNALADNSTIEGRATNRRTRIILMPRLNQFYDLLKPTNIEVK
jgi:chemotaxis protein MotB